MQPTKTLNPQSQLTTQLRKKQKKKKIGGNKERKRTQVKNIFSERRQSINNKKGRSKKIVGEERLQHKDSNHCLGTRTVEQRKDKRQFQNESDKEMRLLGINSIFIGIDALGTPNDRASGSALFETMHHLTEVSITTPLLKCPLDATCHVATEKV